MAQANTSNAANQRQNPMQLSIEACKSDDVSLMEQAISAASLPNSRHTVQDIIQRSTKRAAARRSPRVLQHLLDKGADVTLLTASDTMHPEEEPLAPSLEVLEMLVAHGWDINAQGPQGTERPLLWQVVQSAELVKWCLSHGASVDVPEKPPHVNADGTRSYTQRPRPKILGAAAAYGTVETFELLRAKSAPLEPRTLHLAVEQATLLAPEEGGNGSAAYVRRMDMVRHLVNELKLDVNAIQPEVGSQCSTPLCYVARRSTSQDFRELVGLLLERGAKLRLDVNSEGAAHLMDPSACAQSSGNTQFLRAVEEWQSRRGAEDTS